MKLSTETIELLKNFSSINTNILIEAGSKIKTISPAKNILASKTVAEVFPNNFGIYDLPEFLGVISLFENPELEFSDSEMKITQGTSKIIYVAASPSILTLPPNKEVTLSETVVEFKLTSQILSNVLKSASVLKYQDLAVVGDSKTLKLVVSDKQNVSSNKYELEVGTTDKTFKVFFKTENFKFMQADYDVIITKKKIAKFSAPNTLEYYVAIEADSDIGS